MEPSPLFCNKILQLIGQNYQRSCTLEELTSMASLFLSVKPEDRFSPERENQAAVLDALLLLSEKGHIFLNSYTDQSCITIKGLLAIGDKTICN
ncbi:MULTISPECIES: hypothetical protein [Flavobacterium]|uniref:hypothetical protein n=1 Tax=Flavobacterium TaxID=237 RepID=UPI002113AC1F|nr:MULTISPECIES: hypothetical protein [Flavobacterium]UUF13091.1 hypothetical protein NLJ00_17675 [Flavobacterium panici]